jgi:hypothetical protein
LIAKINKIYHINNFPEVSDFLYKHQEQFFIILEAEKQIRKYFLNDRLVLKIITDS